MWNKGSPCEIKDHHGRLLTVWQFCKTWLVVVFYDGREDNLLYTVIKRPLQPLFEHWNSTRNVVGLAPNPLNRILLPSSMYYAYIICLENVIVAVTWQLPVRFCRTRYTYWSTVMPWQWLEWAACVSCFTVCIRGMRSGIRSINWERMSCVCRPNTHYLY